ncbi:MAG: uncharacterized protein KVP18_001520 [Porospora cf. gigantea A]|nr:MAG: hypothetical protein KVP18_001520 [Porospora cf. gigantea A]
MWVGVLFVLLLLIFMVVRCLRRRRRRDLQRDVEIAFMEQESKRVGIISEMLSKTLDESSRKDAGGPAKFWAYESQDATYSRPMMSPVPVAAPSHPVVFQTTNGQVEAMPIPMTYQLEYNAAYQRPNALMMPLQQHTVAPKFDDAKRTRMRRARDSELPPGDAPVAPEGYVTVPMVIETLE